MLPTRIVCILRNSLAISLAGLKALQSISHLSLPEAVEGHSLQFVVNLECLVLISVACRST